MIDIIIPTYNAHSSIVKTLHSIAMQTIREKLVVYIVDDYSQDSYDNIIKLFRKWLNIKYLKLNKNSGPGVARQFGIDNSSNDYIMFIDSDDVLYDCFSVENLYNKIIQDSYDMAVGIFVDELNNQYYAYRNHQGCLHGKLYKRSFMKKNDISFNETRNSEDNGFNRLYLLANPKIIFVEDYIYVYKDNKNSITQSDPDNYQFYSVEPFIYNMVWAATKAEMKGFDSKLIASHIFESYLYVYYMYLVNFNRNGCDAIYSWCKDLHQLYLKYNNLLSEHEKYSLYCDYLYFVDFDNQIPNFRLLQIPKMSLNEFIYQVYLHNK